MLHLVYFSPDNLSDLAVLSEAGGAALVGCLQNLLQNCLLLDFKDWRFDSVRAKVEDLPEGIRKRVKSLLAIFAKRNRIVHIAEDDYGSKVELELLAEQATQLGLELVIIRAEGEWDETTTGVAQTTIAAYALSDFEAKRSEDVADRHFNDGEMSGDEFITRYLVPLLRFAQRLDIWDGALGEHYRDDYGHTIDRLFDAIRRVSRQGNDLKITIRCRRGVGSRPGHVQTTIDDLALKHQLAGRVRITFYGDPAQRKGFEFKHDRCLASDIGVLNIGRGFDFIRKVDDRIRDTTLGLGGPDPDTIVASYAASESTPGNPGTN